MYRPDVTASLIHFVFFITVFKWHCFVINVIEIKESFELQSQIPDFKIPDCIRIMVDDRQYMICNVWNRNKQGSQSVKKKRDKNSKIAVMQTSCQNTLALFLSIIHSGRHLLLFHKRFPVRIFLQAKSLHQGYSGIKMILVPYIGCDSENRNNRKNPCDGNVGNLSANLFLNE